MMGKVKWALAETRPAADQMLRQLLDSASQPQARDARQQEFQAGS